MHGHQHPGVTDCRCAFAADGLALGCTAVAYLSHSLELPLLRQEHNVIMVFACDTARPYHAMRSNSL